MFDVSAPKFIAANTPAVSTKISQIRAKVLVSKGRTTGSVAVRKRSGSHIGIRTASGDQIFCLISIRLCRWWRRNSSRLSGDTSATSASAACSCPNRRIASSWVGARSPSCSLAISQTSPRVRSPSSIPTMRYAAGENRCDRPVAKS